MRSTAELYAVDPRAPLNLNPPRTPLAEPIGRIGVTDHWALLRERNISPPVFQSALRRWTLKYRPDGVVSNLRPGLPCLMAYYALRGGWELWAIVCRNQIEKAPSDIQHSLIELWHKADRTHTAADPVERDQLIKGLVPNVTIGNIMAGTVPIMGTDVVPCDLQEDGHGHQGEH